MSVNEKILKSGKNCYRIAPSDQTDVLIDAALFYKAVYHSILKAQKYLLFSGWQFDSRVCLLRGKDADAAGYPVAFLPLLQRVASERPDLQIYILAWDHSIVFAPEREWWQGYRFHNVSPQIHFQFDHVHPTNASHHQKIVVADGQVGFCGGLDLCGDRWDTPQHRRRNLLRANTDGTRYDLFHDVQVAVQGEAVGVLEEIFCDRWVAATGETLTLPQKRREAGAALWDLPHSVRLPGMPVGISRTVPAGCCGQRSPIQEIARFYVEAIEVAERLIFIENQYFTSRTIFEALMKRLQQKERSPLEVIIILPHRPQNWKEQIAIGFEQRRMLQRLEEAAKAAGGAVGAYTPIKQADEKQNLPAQLIYVHSKVLVVDDRLLSIGSANTTNRSLGLDTECNINLEAESEEQRQRITRTCATLLAEHLDQPVDAVDAIFKGHQIGWVAYLNDACEKGTAGRLQKFNEAASEYWVEQILPEGICFDPESPLQAENFFEEMLGFYDEEDDEERAEGKNEGTKEGGRAKEIKAEQGAPQKRAGWLLTFRSGTVWKGALLGFLPLVGLAFFLYLQPHKQDAIFWVDLLEKVQASSWTIPFFLTGMVAASLVSFPIVSLLILGGILFGPLWGTLWGWSGALLGATASYFVGDYFGEPLIKRWGGKKIEAANKWVEKKGFWAILTLRVVGIFPFTVVNFCAGASRMPFTQYFVGTAAGMLPGTFLISYFAHAMLEGTVRFPSKKTQLLIGLPILLVWVSGSLFKKWWIRRRERIPKHV